ncbi:cyclic nucleotide-binding domain-containing protein [Acidaminobacter sp. JC074]|uniref:Crp/Fnr family transcriptional regulator n=1 Tax=Acidaminobacter sp. JC074 TaxID=2530199 RepID=UPI001F0FE979
MLKVLLNNPIFKDCDLKTIETYLGQIPIVHRTFDKNETAYDDKHYEKNMMILMSGSARVELIQDGECSFLKRLNPGDMFGVLSLFTEDNYYPTKIIFEKKSQVISLSEAALIELLHKDPRLLKNYLVFFNGQVQYLLNRIALFSISNGEDRVIGYLSRLKSNTQSNRLELPMSKVELAEYLGIARSTLYRVFDKLIENKMIEMEGNSLHIIGGIK